jgi:hypothetical protein
MKEFMGVLLCGLLLFLVLVSSAVIVMEQLIRWAKR